MLEAEADEYMGRVTYTQVGTEEELDRAEKVFAEQIAKTAVDVVSTRLMRWCLPRLGAAASTEPLKQFRLLAFRYAHIMPAVALYVQTLMGTEFERDAVRATTRWLNDGGFKYPWQVGWLLNALVHSRESSSEIKELGPRLMLTDSLPWFVRGQAALVTATENALPPHRRFFDVYEQCPDATKPDLIAAVVWQEPAWAAAFLKGAATTPVLAAVAGMNRDGVRNSL